MAKLADIRQTETVIEQEAIQYFKIRNDEYKC